MFVASYFQTIETIYVMWRYTGDVKWRERGWKIYEAIERYTKTPIAYGEYWDVGIAGSQPMDNMPRFALTYTTDIEYDKNLTVIECASFFLAETLKYLYLLFSDETHSLPVDKWIFNT